MNNIHERIANLDKMIDKEPNPIIREHYRNVIRQLQTKLEQI